MCFARFVAVDFEVRTAYNGLESSLQGDAKKDEYDFSKGARGKFYHSDTRPNFPVYLDDDIVEFVQKYAQRTKVDMHTVVNEMLRSDKEIMLAL